MSVLINELNENAKIAREQALFGNYETSSLYYQGAVQQIHKIIAQTTEPHRRSRWLEVSDELYVYTWSRIESGANGFQVHP